MARISKEEVIQKVNHIEKIIKRNRFNPLDLLFIGDADIDILAAKHYGIPIIFRIHSDNHVKYYKMVEVNDLKNIGDKIEKINSNYDWIKN